MFDWKWVYIMRTGETITVYTRDGNRPSKTKAIVELARAYSGGDGRSEETLLKIGRSLKPKRLSLEKQNLIIAASSPAFGAFPFSNANLF